MLTLTGSDTDISINRIQIPVNDDLIVQSQVQLFYLHVSLVRSLKIAW